MFAIRGVVQESLGCSPSELVFAHTVSGPLKLLREKWFCEGTEQSLLDNVSNFRAKLCRACEITSSSLEAAHVRMKGWFDRHNKSRECMPGDKVLMLAGLQACYCGLDLGEGQEQRISYSHSRLSVKKKPLSH